MIRQTIRLLVAVALVNFVGMPRLVHRFVDVRITSALPHSLRGEIVTSES